MEMYMFKAGKQLESAVAEIGHSTAKNEPVFIGKVFEVNDECGFVELRHNGSIVAKTSPIKKKDFCLNQSIIRETAHGAVSAAFMTIYQTVSGSEYVFVPVDFKPMYV